MQKLNFGKEDREFYNQLWDSIKNVTLTEQSFREAQGREKINSVQEGRVATRLSELTEEAASKTGLEECIISLPD